MTDEGESLSEEVQQHITLILNGHMDGKAELNDGDSVLYRSLYIFKKSVDCEKGEYITFYPND